MLKTLKELPARKLLQVAQVELHGTYSADRLQRLQAYLVRCRTARVLAVLAATSVPCVAVIVLLDALELNPPANGPHHSVAFWVRSSAIIAICTLSFIVQFHTALPMVRIKRSWIFFSTVVVTGGTMLTDYALALLIGFPIPFMLVVESPVWLGMLISSLALGSASYIRASAAARASLEDWVKVGLVQISILFVYPIFNYAFMNVSTIGQAALSLTLVVVKLVYKNVTYRCVSEQPDLRAEIVTFNVEISNALFSTFSMQNATSIFTLVVVILVDVVHSCATLHEVHKTILELNVLELEMNAARDAKDPNTDAKCALLSAVSQAKTPTVVDKAYAIAAQRRQQDPSWAAARSLQSHTQLKVKSAKSKQAKKYKSGKVAHGEPAQDPVHDRLDETPSSAPETHDTSVGRSGSQINMQSFNIGKKTGKRPPSVGRHGSGRKRDLTQIEDEFLHVALKLLHLTEFTVLSEFIEFVVPFIYGETLPCLVSLVLCTHVSLPMLSPCQRSTWP